jgi:hypothetical protein
MNVVAGNKAQALELQHECCSCMPNCSISTTHGNACSSGSKARPTDARSLLEQYKEATKQMLAQHPETESSGVTFDQWKHAKDEEQRLHREVLAMQQVMGLDLSPYSR